MADSTKDQTRIEIKPPPLPFPSADFTENLQEHRTPFFKSSSRLQRDTWVVSFFVLLHIGAFVATMIVNDCWKNSNGDCALKQFGRLSCFQPLSENPLLGPSASTLDQMGALRRTFLGEYHQIWRLFTSSGLHAGGVHLIINLCCVVFVGIHLEQQFGPLRMGAIYILSAFVGSLVGALFVSDSPAVGSSGALFGLVGAMLSGLIRNWKFYTNKFAALASLFSIFLINITLGLLPYVSNFSNIGGFISGFLLGFVLLFRPQVRQIAQNKGGLYDYGVKRSLKLKQKLDRPILRIISLLLFCLLLAVCLVAVLRGINMNQYCSWCRYIECVPSKGWSCHDITTSCETRISDAQLTLTCIGNGNFRVFPYTNISPTRIKDLCSLICS